MKVRRALPKISRQRAVEIAEQYTDSELKY